MPNRRYNCRTHPGGVFSMPPRKGRAPVKCTSEHPCSLASAPVSRAEKVASTIKNRAESPTETPDPRAASLAKALNAKGQLEPLGWVCKGTPYGDTGVRLQAARDTERLVIIFEEGKEPIQDYSLWGLSPAVPAHKLPFDPYEAPDETVIAHLSGMPVKWWSELRQAEESAIVGSGRIKIERLFNGPHQSPEGRIISFIDHGGGGFRSFRLSALTKVG